MKALRLTSSNSDVVFELSAIEDEYFRVSVTSRDHSATRLVYAHIRGEDLPRLFADAAKEWRGWQGPKVWESLEGELRIELSSSGLGHVTVAARLRSDPGAADLWQLDAELGLDAGQLEAVAREANKLWSGGS